MRVVYRAVRRARAPGRVYGRATDMDPIYALSIPAAVVVAIYLMRSIRQVNQWETALKFTLGKLSGQIEQGHTRVGPAFQPLVRFTNRIRTRALPYQQVITRDNVTAQIDA